MSAGLLYGLDADQLASAMGIAASMGSGVIEANRTGGTVKRVHCGWAAHGGITAAALAREGVTGPPTVLEGRFGFFNAYLDGRYDEAALLDGLGERWELIRTVYKPYPSNHFTHPAIDCALALRAAGLDPADIESVELGVAAPVLRTIAEPREDKIRPRTPYHAKFSGPFTVATALLGGGGLGVYLDDFTDETFTDPVRLALAAKVELVADERATEIFPNGFAAVLRVRTKAGALLEHRVDSSRGGPEHPLSRDELLHQVPAERRPRAAGRPRRRPRGRRRAAGRRRRRRRLGAVADPGARRGRARGGPGPADSAQRRIGELTPASGASGHAPGLTGPHDSGGRRAAGAQRPPDTTLRPCRMPYRVCLAEPRLAHQPPGLPHHGLVHHPPVRADQHPGAGRHGRVVRRDERPGGVDLLG